VSRKVIGAVVLVVCLIGGGLIWLIDPIYLRVPKDAVVSQYFESHRATFERLRDMALNDAHLASRFAANGLDEKLGQDRSRQYQSLFAQLPPGVVVTTHRQSVRFIFATGGLLSIGSEWIKGIEYLPSASTDWGKSVNNLDDPAHLATGDVYLREVQPQWFLFLQKTE
jgi:hypothetical protein